MNSKRSGLADAADAAGSDTQGSAGLIWSRPEPASRKPGLTRDQIAAAALRVADAEGLDTLSMRRVARELGVGTMSVYYYVRTKDELLSLMHNALAGELLVPDDELPSQWRPALELLARRSRDVFHRHPWVIKGPPMSLGPNALRHDEQSLAAVSALTVDSAAKYELVKMVDDYVFGFAIGELKDNHLQPQEDGKERADAMAAYIEEQFATGNFPHMERIIGREGAREKIEHLEGLAEPTRDDARFERGLKRLFDGIALNLPEPTRPQLRP
jgi:AcrR family transcriptional regulator